jgi:hypothetical protein
MARRDALQTYLVMHLLLLCIHHRHCRGAMQRAVRRLPAVDLQARCGNSAGCQDAGAVGAPSC